MGRRNLGEVPLAGLQVVVEAIDARVFEPLGLLLVQKPERSAQRQIELALDALRGFADHVQVASRRSARGRDHAVAERARLGRAPRAGDQRLDGAEGRLARLALIRRALGAEAAVLGTGTELCVLEYVDVHLPAVKRAANAKRRVDKSKQLIGLCVEDGPGLIASEAFAGDGGVGEFLPEIGNTSGFHRAATVSAGRRPQQERPRRHWASL